ncbi:MAG TPA: glycoside hydrolase family 2 TIM barrel-domain containing protein [Terriglobia bacterium]|nr:glycoside hydrolase family 2 TIM barrel-domain containing protein [Terriglobia bacterium]
MSRVNGKHPTRRRFLEELGVSAAATVTAGGVCGLQVGALGRSSKASSGKERSDALPAGTASVRQEIDLSGRWGFQVDYWDEGQKLGYFSLEFATKGWQEVSIPRAFDDCAPGMYKFRGICWFSRQFEVPVSIRGQRVAVHFEGVNYNSSVWVNGKLVGQNEDAFLPFEFPVEELLRFGENNLIVVRVDNMRHPAQLPTSEFWQGQGGILREVKLIVTEQVRVTHVGITAAPNDDKGKFALRALVSNGSSQPADLSLHVKILDRGGQLLASFTAKPLAVEAGKEAELSVGGEVAEVMAWSPEQPTLYSARVDLLVEGKLADQWEAPFGFRRIEARNGKLWLNGKPVFLMGFDRHEDSPRTGMAVDLETSRQDFLGIKDTGSNFVRFCHYPHHPGELQLCDELGLLVLAEIPLCGWGNKLNDPFAGAGWNPSDVPTILEGAERALRKMILRDFNHPSIIIWSVSNESEEQHPEVNHGNNRLIRLGQQLDPTRLMTHVSISDCWTSEKERKYFEYDDVICVNGYPGAQAHTGDNSWLEKVTQWWRDELARLHTRYLEKPIVITEFGYMSIEGTNGPMGEDTQALGTEAEFRGMDAPYVSGASLWCFAKHAWPAGCFDFDISPCGYVSRDRKRKMKAYFVVRNMFRQRAESLTR